MLRVHPPHESLDGVGWTVVTLIYIKEDEITLGRDYSKPAHAVSPVPSSLEDEADVDTSPEASPRPLDRVLLHTVPLN